MPEEPSWLTEQLSHIYPSQETQPLQVNGSKKKAGKPKAYQKPDSSNVVVPLDVFDFNDLLREEFEPLQWIIPEYLPEGLTLLFARPKVGKSMLALALSLRMARRVSGGVDGTVLYLTLDDTNKRRLQSRTRSLLQGEEIEGSRVWGATQAQTLDSNLVGQLEDWMKEHPLTRLMVIDVYARIKPKKVNDDVYKSDYDALCKLQEFAVRYHLAIILVHHTRKQADTGDWIDNINGSTGLAGAVDTIWMLERAARSNNLVLRVKGRDIMNELAIGLTLDELDAPWKLEEEGLEVIDVSVSEQKILDAFWAENYRITELQGKKDCNSVILVILTPKKIAELTQLKYTTVLGTLRRMLQKNLVTQTTYGSYRIAAQPEIAVDENPTTVMPVVVIPHCQDWKCILGPNRTHLIRRGNQIEFWCKEHQGYINEKGRPIL